MIRTGTIVLEAQKISFSYRRPVLNGVSLGLAKGTITGIIGPNGSGKTTLLRLLDGILSPSSGKVLLDGTPLLKRRRKEVARRIAMVPQNGSSYYYHTVLQFTLLGRAPHLPLLGFESRYDEDIAREALELTQLIRYRDARVSEISGGERQRLLLARALSQRAEILLLDEFTANLDINYQVELMRLVRRITRERELATLVVSHEINLLAAFCDRMILMTNGTIQREGKVPDVINRENLRNLFGLDFRVNLLPQGIPEVMPDMNGGSAP